MGLPAALLWCLAVAAAGTSAPTLTADWLLAPLRADLFFATQFAHDLFHGAASAVAPPVPHSVKAETDALRRTQRSGHHFAPVLPAGVDGLIDASLDAVRTFGVLHPPFLKTYRGGVLVREGALGPRSTAATVRAQLSAGDSFVVRLEDALRQQEQRAAAAVAVDDSGGVTSSEDALAPLRELRANLERLFVTTVSMHLYLSAPGSDVLKPHTDPYDVFILQLAGRKRWKVCVPRWTAAPGNGSTPSAEADAAPPGSRGQQAAEYELDHTASAEACTTYTHGDMLRMDACRSLTLSPGDVLYMPKGFVHSAHTLEGEASVHLTIGIKRSGRRWRDLVANVADDDALGSGDSHIRAALARAATVGSRRAEWNAMAPLHDLACASAGSGRANASDAVGVSGDGGDDVAAAAAAALPQWCIDYGARSGDALERMQAQFSALIVDLAQHIEWRSAREQLASIGALATKEARLADAIERVSVGAARGASAAVVVRQNGTPPRQLAISATLALEAAPGVATAKRRRLANSESCTFGDCSCWQYSSSTPCPLGKVGTYNDPEVRGFLPLTCARARAISLLCALSPQRERVRALRAHVMLTSHRAPCLPPTSAVRLRRLFFVQLVRLRLVRKRLHNNHRRVPRDGGSG